MSLRGPSPHLTWKELACHDERRTPYPLIWRQDRAVRLATAFEWLRTRLGVPLLVVSGYRTRAWNTRVGGQPKSQHLEGRALDLVPVRGASVEECYAAARALALTAKLGQSWLIRGLGHYTTFVHIDVRPSARLVEWEGP